MRLGYGDIEGPVPVPAVPVGPSANSFAALTISASATPQRFAASSAVNAFVASANSSR